MQYYDGEKICLGDEVDTGNHQYGTIVGIIEEEKYKEPYKKEDWDSLERGILIDTVFGILRYIEVDEDLVLISRG